MHINIINKIVKLVKKMKLDSLYTYKQNLAHYLIIAAFYQMFHSLYEIFGNEFLLCYT